MRFRAVLLIVFVSCAPGQGEPPPRPAAAPPTAKAPQRLRTEIVAVFPHDTAAYTQGLVFLGGALFESTGLYGASSVRRVELATGKVEQEVKLPNSYFGEGLAAVEGRLVQLTWREGLAFVYDAAQLLRTGELRYPGDGWGLCWDGEHLVMSDGSALLTFREPSTFAEVRKVLVQREGSAVYQLNELECVEGEIWANVYQSEDIVRIDPASGEVTAVVNATGLLTSEERQSAEVLNGIAWHTERKTFFLTGKFWPKLFEVRFVPVSPYSATRGGS